MYGLGKLDLVVYIPFPIPLEMDVEHVMDVLTKKETESQKNDSLHHFDSIYSRIFNNPA